jgi:hypothetical protein
MQSRSPIFPHPTRGQLAATLVEVVIGLGLLGIMATALFGGMSISLTHTRMAREELRATQIMVERMEGIRLFNWDQLNYSNDLCPPAFTASFDPQANDSSVGVTYYGTMLITNVSLDPAPSYTDRLREITVSVDWTNFGVAHHRTMTTYQAQYGMQNYIFNN